MKKIKYYYTNEEGTKILVRTSANEYRYALVYKKATDNKGTIKEYQIDYFEEDPEDEAEDEEE